MRGFLPGRLALALVCFFALSQLAGAADPALVSSMRNVNAVMEAQGFRINPAFEHSGYMIEGDLGPVQAFEIIRPDGRAFSIGRLYTSCTCIQLESPKRSFAENERAILLLRNTRPTPTNGQIYAIYVQITSPIRTTLRFDTFVQSNHPLLEAAAENAEAQEQAAADDVEELSAPPAIAAAETTPAPEVESAPEIDADTETAEAPAEGRGFEVVVMDADTADESEEGAEPAPEATSDQAGSVETDDAAFGEESDIAQAQTPEEMISQFDAIAAEAEERVKATAAAAAESMAASMDEYFNEVGSTLPEAMPPPAELALPETPVEPASAAPAPATSGTRLEEAVQSASVTPAAPAETVAPVSGAKPLRNVSLITIGVRDIFRSMRFYQALGWEMAPRGKYDQTAFFQLNGQVLVLYPMPEMLREQNMENANPSPGGITLAIHVGSKEEAYSTYRTFIEAGGLSLKEPTEMLSGSVTSYVADPDGNAWEISWVPQFMVDENGWLWLNQGK